MQLPYIQKYRMQSTDKIYSFLYLLYTITHNHLFSQET